MFGFSFFIPTIKDHKCRCQKPQMRRSKLRVSERRAKLAWAIPNESSFAEGKAMEWRPQSYAMRRSKLCNDRLRCHIWQSVRMHPKNDTFKFENGGFRIILCNFRHKTITFQPPPKRPFRAQKPCVGQMGQLDSCFLCVPLSRFPHKWLIINYLK